MSSQLGKPKRELAAGAAKAARRGPGTAGHYFSGNETIASRCLSIPHRDFRDGFKSLREFSIRAGTEENNKIHYIVLRGSD